MPLPIIRDITITGGDTHRLIFRWKDDQANPIDLTGATAEFEIYNKKSDPSLILSIGSCPIPTNGEVIFTLSDAETLLLLREGFARRSYNYTVIVNQNPDITTLLKGKVKVLANT